ncbi:beta-4C adrenergic receptor-like [Acanthaster planci]|uniref:Beta-4C adrenergic receptor-like n=1 Tax=Acanthaster planci TaxID=133434 RepID=A0A8B8A290_ACAPL|nr:beta-4C adrenergic receptor-like [Acanthaster planci]
MAASATVLETTFIGSPVPATAEAPLCRSDAGPSGAQIVVEIVILAVVSCLGVFGNALVIAAVAITPSLCTTANYFIFGLACVDLVNSGILAPIFIFTLVEGNWPHEDTYCKVVGYMTIFCLATSESALICLAGTRYLIVTKPKDIFARYFKAKFVVVYIIIFLIFQLTILFLPLWSDIGNVGFSHVNSHCTFVICDRKDWYYPLILFLFCMVINLGIIPTFYLLTFRTVAKSKRAVKALQALQGTAQDRHVICLSPQEVQLTKKLLLLFLVFMVCWFPYSIAIFADGWQTVPPLVHQVTNLLIWLSAGLNPYIYAFRIRNFRKAFRRILLLPWRKCHFRRPRGASASENLGTSMVDRHESHP